MKRYLSLIIILTMILALASGCSTNTQTPSETPSESPSESTPAAPSEAAPTEEAPPSDQADQPAPPADEQPAEPEFNSIKAEYPLTTTGETLTFFAEYPGFLAGHLDSLSDHAGYLKAEEITGVHIDFHEVSMFAMTEQFNLMAVAGTLPDIVSGVSAYPGGTASAIEEDVILDLTDLVHTVMGNYWELLSANPDWIKAAIDDNGFMGTIMSLTSASYATSGPQMRADWLEALGFDAPETYDDYYEVLMAFKVEYDPTDNFQLLGATQQMGGGWVGGYGTIGASEASASGSIAANMFLDSTGKVQNGYMVDSYKDYLMMMNKWYNDGLMNQDFYSKVNDPMAGDADALILGGNSGLWYAQSNFIGDYMSKATTPGYKIVGTKEPVLEENRGDNFHFGINGQGTAGGGVALSANCSNPELAAKWLDFWYTEQGQMICAYGVEDLSYTMVDGKPQYSELITNNPNLIYQFAVAMYTVSQVPTISDPSRSFSDYTQETIDAIELWTDTQDDLYALPSITLTVEESEEYSKLIADINTFATESIMKFVININNFEDDWDFFIQNIQTMGIDRCIAIYQAAYDRYMSK